MASGPAVQEELEAQEAVFPSADAIPFGPDEARVAADLYQRAGRARGREIDLAIAACALSWQAKIWTLNRVDFEDVPGLTIADVDGPRRSS